MNAAQILASFLLAAERQARRHGYVGRRIRWFLLPLVHDPVCDGLPALANHS